MNIVLIADAYPPLRSSGAVQMRDLSLEFVRQGYRTTVMIPSPELDCDWRLEHWDGVQILRLKAPRTKDVGYARRTIGELLMPFFMLKNLKKSPLAKQRWNGVVWYSPTIFLGPVAGFLKKASGCRSYLIVRDIFPEWAVDMGLMRRSLPYYFFKLIERYQYSVANVIGVQTPANVGYLDNWARKVDRHVEVLQNWLATAPLKPCSINVAKTALVGRKIFVYAGNMGVAQGMNTILDLADRLQHRTDIGFLFVGRGTDAKRLREEAARRELDNVAFFDEIDPSEIAGLYDQCHVGLVALDRRHKTHNIPGKFLSYMQSGLPVLASINPGNDLADLIKQEGVGEACTDGSTATLERLATALADQLDMDGTMPSRCKALAANLFAPKGAVSQIVQAVAGRQVAGTARPVSVESAGVFMDEMEPANAGFGGNQH
jgi:glycosyltransferase involved in cell wall biosynthesis